MLYTRLAMAVMLGLASMAAAAQSNERALDAERRAVEAERGAVAAERRAAESERRALELDRDASAGSSRTSSDVQPRACQAATDNYEFVCSYPSRNGIGDDPQCATAQAEMREQCDAAR
jgi:hypothetical protein